MEKSYQKVLQENHEVIAREIVQDNKTEDVIYELTAKDVLTTQFRDQLLDEETTKTNKIRRLVQNLQYLGPNAYRLFLEVLIQLDLSVLACKLDPDLTDQLSNHIGVQNDVLDNLKHMPYIHPLGTRSSSKDDDLLSLPTLPNMARRRSHPKMDPATGQTVGSPVNITPPLEPLTIMVTPAVEIYGIDKDCVDLYKNCSMPRGLVFMANYKDFANNQHKSRNGSEMDVKNLTLLFTQMGYKVPKQHINMTRNETVKAIREFTKNPKLKEVDSCIVIIMSHGRDEKSFYTSDNHYLPINEVVEKFSNSECPSLKGKPKIFIFQYCRGPLEDIGVSNQVRPVVHNIQQHGGQTVETDAANFGEAGVIRDATYTDMFIIYSTVEGYVSFRHPQRGSWLIEAICDIFMKNAYGMDLDALMKKVSQMVRKNYTDHGTKQVCEIVSRAFDRHFYFNPQALQDTCSMNMGALTRVLSESNCSLEGAVSNGPISPGGVPYSPGMTPPPHTRRFKPGISLENLQNISRATTPEPLDQMHNGHRSRRRNYSGNSNHSEQNLNDLEGNVVLRHPQVRRLSGSRRRSMSPNSKLNSYQHQQPTPGFWGRTISDPAHGSKERIFDPKDDNVFAEHWRQANMITEEINQNYVEESFDIVDSPMTSLEPVTCNQINDTGAKKTQGDTLQQGGSLPQMSKSDVQPWAVSDPHAQMSQSYMQSHAASEGEEEDEHPGLKRQLSSPSTQETLFKINDIKRYMQVNDADEQYMHGLSRVESFLKKMKNIGKKRKKENEASSLDY
ncbi:unnamed protein product [Meganyctiphanes norvegica]|uniref:Uncharacterized protein n=1 Tax=Meganyctiphanes norvegica TaxID=48144 RepID=A0AAV2QXF3_MEGNR